ncbi:MAG TPA: hypothetical protein VKB09_15255 [Thermomicrobiales bacterium]|nr:hypothetical protein [Thermomicrobiales bacterium]
MGTEDNKALARRFYEEVWDKGNTDFAFEVFADDTSAMISGLLRRLPARSAKSRSRTISRRLP